VSIFNREPRTDTPIVATLHDEVREACIKLGVDLNPDHVDALTVADFVRLAYREGVRATEQRLMSSDVADAIAVAIEDPKKLLQCSDSESLLMHWRVRAIQQAAVYGVPK
jgi:hypothetical protein